MNQYNHLPVFRLAYDLTLELHRCTGWLPRAAAITTAAHYGIIDPQRASRESDRLFVRPDDTLTRVELAKIIANTRKLLR